MVKSETRRDAEILVRNPSPRLFGEKFRDSKKVKTNHEKKRLRDLSKTFPRRFSRYHSPPLLFGDFLKYKTFVVRRRTYFTPVRAEVTIYFEKLTNEPS